MEFNETKDTGPTRTENYEGGEAFEADTPEMALYNLTVNNLLEDTFYRDDEDAFHEVRAAFNEVADSNPEFPLKLAKYARQEMYLRDISQVLLVLSAYHPDTKEYVTDYAPDVIDRADEPATILAMWEWLSEADWFDKETSDTVPKPLKKGIGFAMQQFDAYQLAKYDTDRREKNLKDVLNMVRPHPSDESQNELYRRLTYGELDETSTHVEGYDDPVHKNHWTVGHVQEAEDVDSLPTPETWESVISERGNTREAWEDVLPRMGLFARVRNLRNMLEAGVIEGDILNTPIKGKDYESGEYFTIDEDGMSVDTVRKSKMYPFRFYTAYLQLEKANVRAPQVSEFLEEAVNVGAEELSETFGNSVVGVDVSGSMRHPLSRNSVMEYIDISALFGGIFGTKGARTYGFATDHAEVDAHPSTPAIEYARKFYQYNWGQGTQANNLMNHVRTKGIEADRVVLLTDGQIWRARGYNNTFKEEWEKYKETVAPGASLYILDLSSYSTLAMPEHQEDVYQISGWNDNVLDFIQNVENPSDVIQEVEDIGPSFEG